MQTIWSHLFPVQEDSSHSAVLIWWLCLFFWVLAGIRFGIEDLTTTALGYEALPTRDVYPDTGYWVALSLFVLPIVGSIRYQMYQKRSWLYIALASLLIDIAFDMTYRVVADPTSQLTNWGIEMGIAALQSLLIFTLGSEVAFSVGLPLLIDLTPAVFHRVFGWFQEIVFPLFLVEEGEEMPMESDFE